MRKVLTVLLTEEHKRQLRESLRSHEKVMTVVRTGRDDHDGMLSVDFSDPGSLDTFFEIIAEKKFLPCTTVSIDLHDS